MSLWRILALAGFMVAALTPAHAQSSKSIVLHVDDIAIADKDLPIYHKAPSNWFYGNAENTKMMLPKGTKIKVIGERKISAVFSYHEWVLVEFITEKGGKEIGWAYNGEKGLFSKEKYFTVTQPAQGGAR